MEVRSDKEEHQSIAQPRRDWIKRAKACLQLKLVKDVKDSRNTIAGTLAAKRETK